jgi:recombination protein RecT
MTDTIAGAVARRSDIEARLDKHVGWFDTIMPSHMPARQLVALAVGEFRKVRDLREAAEANPASFMAAVAECARLGLVPGDTGFLIGFKDKNAPGGKAVSFMTHWRGEVELIHRTGEVETVVCQIVRKHDHFRWVPSEMRIPEHHIPEDDDSGQVGLSGAVQRGPITGVYCYVRFKDGGRSFPTVMHISEVRKHYDVAKTHKFWGEWPVKDKYPPETTAGAWTEDMVRKTAVHKHSDSVPKSPEYLMAKVAQGARIAETIPDEIAAAYQQVAETAAADQADPGAPDMNGGTPSARTIAGAVEERRDGGAAPRVQRNADVKAINDLFREHGLDGKQWETPRLLIIGAAASENPDQPVEVKSPAALTADQAARALAVIAGAIDDLTKGGRPVRAGLLSVASARGWAGEVPDEGGIGTDPGDPDG